MIYPENDATSQAVSFVLVVGAVIVLGVLLWIVA